MIGLAIGIWLTGSILFLFGIPAIGKIGRHLPWRDKDRVLAGLAIGLGALAVIIFGLWRSSEHWWVLFLVGPWLLSEIYPFFGASDEEEVEEEEEYEEEEDDEEETEEEESDEEEAEEEDAGAEEEEPAEEETVTIYGLTAQEAAILHFLHEVGEEADIQVAPNIEAEALHTARKSCNVPPDEHVLALIDYAGGYERVTEGIVFGSRGIHFHVQRHGQPLTGSIAYSEFPRRVFVNHGWEIYLGDGLILPLPEFCDSGEQWTNILNGIKHRMATAKGV
jgi:hypothetical protein